MDWILSPDIWTALLALTALEIVLGIDNVVFLVILAGKLPSEQQYRARMAGLGLALISRVLLLLSLAWMIRLTTPLFHVFGHGISGRDLILITGGLFLIGRSTQEIHARLEGEEEGVSVTQAGVSFLSVIVQIVLLDMVFSLDSVITAVGMVEQVAVMIAAVIIGASVMIVASNGISAFVGRHPTMKMLALSFLLLIGTALVAEGFDVHVPKGYIYFSMGFAIFVETLNLRGRSRREAKVSAVSRSPKLRIGVAQAATRPSRRSMPHGAMRRESLPVERVGSRDAEGVVSGRSGADRLPVP